MAIRSYDGDVGKTYASRGGRGSGPNSRKTLLGWIGGGSDHVLCVRHGSDTEITLMMANDWDEWRRNTKAEPVVDVESEEPCL